MELQEPNKLNGAIDNIKPDQPFNLREASAAALAKAIASAERIPLTNKQQETMRALRQAIAEVQALAADKTRMFQQTIDIMMNTILEERGSNPNGMYDLTPDGTALYLKEMKPGTPGTGAPTGAPTT